MKQLLYAESVSKKIGSKQILQNISLNLSGGNVYGFVGENGSGKTMLFRILSGLVKPTTGKVCLNRTDIHKGRCSERIGVIIENSCMWPELTGWENLLFLGSLNKRISKADIRTTLETVVLLSKGEIDSKKVRVEFSLEDMDMSGFQKDATYEQIKAYVLEHTGLKVSSLYISQIKRKCGLDVGQNYNLSKKEDAKVPKCPPEKEAAIRDALKYFQMI